MDRRLQLHEKLCDVLGSRNCYYQPPESIKLQYPCIIYKWAAEDVKPADNLRFFTTRAYDVTIVDTNPDSQLPEMLSNSFSLCRFDRHYTADNLHHFTYRLYY